MCKIAVEFVIAITAAGVVMAIEILFLANGFGAESARQ